MKRFLFLVTAVAVVGGAAAAPMTQTYPDRAIRMVVGFLPGGGTDIMARIVATKLSEGIGRNVIVDNRAGASGQIAAELTAKAAPDGYTIMMAHIAQLSILPSLYAKLPYDPQKDFAPITLVAIGPNVLVVHPSVPAKSVKELIALAKAHPGQLRHASGGIGTVQHLAAELFKLQSKIDMVHVPYKGAGASLIDLVSGQVQLNFEAVPAVINYVRQGRLRALAVTSAKRSMLLPDLPTIDESGLKGFDMSTWWGFVAPAGVDEDVIARLHGETTRLLQENDVKEAFAKLGAEPVGDTPKEFIAFIRAETEKYAAIVKAVNVKIY